MPSQLENLLVTNLNSVSLEKLVRLKLETLFKQCDHSHLEIKNLHSIVIEQVEKPLLELTLNLTQYNQVKAAKILGINRNTLRKKILQYSLQGQSMKNPPIGGKVKKPKKKLQRHRGH